MNQYGIQFEVKNKPSLDPEFMPILKFNRAFLETAKPGLYNMQDVLGLN